MQIDSFGNVRTDTMELFVRKNKLAGGVAGQEDDSPITLGKTTHTKKEWEEMMRRLDRYFETVKEEQKIRAKKLKKQEEEEKFYAKQEWQAKERQKRLLKEEDEHNTTKQLLAAKERYMATPEELAEGEYEISSRDTGATYKFQSKKW